MNNEINQNTISNTQVPITGQQTIQQPVYQQQSQPQTLAQMVQLANEKTNKPVDFESLSPLEKQQLIDKAIREAELKCKIEKPKGWNGLVFISFFLIALCIACIIVLNTLK